MSAKFAGEGGSLFTKLNLPKSLAVLLDILVVLGVGIFVAVCVTVWIAKRYGKRQLYNRHEAKIQSLKSLLSWLKVLISKEAEDMNYVYYMLQQKGKNPFTKKVNTSYIKAVYQLLQELEGIQMHALNSIKDVYCFSIDTSLYNNLLDNYFYKFTKGYYQKVLECLEVVLQDETAKKQFDREEIESIEGILQRLQQLVQPSHNMHIASEQQKYIEIKLAFWRELLQTVEELDLESCLQECLEVERYILPQK